MTLSDEDHVILLDALERYEDGKGLDITACEITLPWKLPEEPMCFMKDRQIADAMYLIIVSEGRGFD
jgi:hypothetical protein